MIRVEMTFQSLAEMFSVLGNHAVTPLPAITPPPVVAMAGEGVSQGNVRKEKPVSTPAASPTSSPAVTASPLAAEAAGDAPTAPDRDTVSKATIKFGAVNPGAARALLTKFGAKAVKELAEDKLAPFYAELQAAAGV